MSFRHSTDASRLRRFRRAILRLVAACSVIGPSLACMQAAAQQAAVAPPMPSNSPYTVAPGDTVDVTFRFTPEFNDEVVVQPDGHVTLKSTGDIRLAGLTLPQATDAIVQGSAAKLVNPDVVVTLKDFARPQIVVAGEVQAPGHFELRKPITALQAVLLAGGPKEDSALGHVYLFRRLNAQSSEVRILDLKHYDARTRGANDILLQPDDMILVSRDTLEKIGRVLKTFNIGLYLNPLPTATY